MPGVEGSADEGQHQRAQEAMVAEEQRGPAPSGAAEAGREVAGAQPLVAAPVPAPQGAPPAPASPLRAATPPAQMPGGAAPGLQPDASPGGASDPGTASGSPAAPDTSSGGPEPMDTGEEVQAAQGGSQQQEQTYGELEVRLSTGLEAEVAAMLSGMPEGEAGGPACVPAEAPGHARPRRELLHVHAGVLEACMQRLIAVGVSASLPEACSAFYRMRIGAVRLARLHAWLAAALPLSPTLSPLLWRPRPAAAAAQAGPGDLPVLPDVVRNKDLKRELPLVCHIIGCGLDLTTQADY